MAQLNISSSIRFEVKKESFIWVEPNELVFVKSADHYVNALVKQGDAVKWMIRHSTIKEMLALLNSDNFIRLNKFYVLNRNYFSRIDSKRRVILLKDGSLIPVTHRISPFMIGLMNGL